MALPPDHNSSSPFLNVFKDGHLIDSFCLDSRDSFVLGRHTNCDVLLAHPSISRHHLKIELLHTTREMLLTDMDSVHGTWIDGKQLPSLVPYTVKEGVAIKLGASSRTFKVQWIHHPMAASSNEKVSTVEAVGSNLPNTVSIASIPVWSSMSNEECMGSNENGYLLPATKSRDSWPSPCCMHEGASPPKMQEIAEAISGNETFNGLVNVSLPQQQKLPPLPPTRRIPFAPLPQNTVPPIVKTKGPIAEKKLEIKAIKKKTADGEENALSGHKLWLRRCNSAPSARLSSPVPTPQLPNPCPPPSTQDSIAANVKLDSKVTYSPLLLTSNTLEKLGTINLNDKETPNDENNASERQLITNLLQEENESPDQGVLARNQSSSVPHSSSCDEAAAEEEYPSDKENQEPCSHTGKQFGGPRMGVSSGAMAMSRRPFQPLTLTPNGFSRPESPFRSYMYAGEDSLVARAHHRPSSVVQNLDYMLQKLKVMARSERHHEWHLVVDYTSLVDPSSLSCLKRLEGINEVRLIVPQIVISELALFNRRGGLGHNGPRAVLEWIESCMLNYPTWIHVQNSCENLPLEITTPPDSPHNIYPLSPACGSPFRDRMSRTNRDHVLKCALLFSNAVFSGRVALLTNDTVLKIKAMAEGLVCESATTFCESLLSPYSDRFLWAGSVAHRLHRTERACQTTSVLPKSHSTKSSGAVKTDKRTFMAVVRAMASKQHHVVENLKNHCRQAQGLKFLLR